MSHDAMKISEDVSVAPSSVVRPSGRTLVFAAALCLSLSACETMKDTMDSINPFDEEQAETTAAETSTADVAADPRKHAVVQAGVDPLPLSRRLGACLRRPRIA